MTRAGLRGNSCPIEAFDENCPYSPQFNQIIRDFIRFTFVIGMRNQALRVQITSRKIRRVVIVQCIVSFTLDFELPLMQKQIDWVVANKTFARLAIVEPLNQIGSLGRV